MRKAIIFDDGQKAVIYKYSDIRTKLTMKQALDFAFAQSVIHVKEKKEILIIGGWHGHPKQ